MKLVWTRTTPTVEGYYFKRHTDPSALVAIKSTTVVSYVRHDEKSGWRVCVQGPLQGYKEYGTALALFLPKYTEWAGPIAMPE